MDFPPTCDLCDAHKNDASGEFRFRFIMAAGVTTSTCHTISFSQGGTGL